MNIFRNYPITSYKFGTSSQVEGVNLIQDLSAYSDVLDQVKDQVTALSFYTVLEGDRPDQLSQKFYGRSDFHWTFWLINDHIRESGWPLDRTELDQFLAAKYSGVAVVTRTDFFGTIPDGSNVAGPTLRVGDTLVGSVSATSATVTKLDPDNGQIFLTGTSLYTATEAATWVDSNGVTQTLIVHASTTYANSIDHAEDADGQIVDYDPTVGPGVLNVTVSLKDMVIRRNEELRQIRLIKPNYIEQIVDTFNRSLQD